MPKPEVKHAGPTLLKHTGKKSDLWIIGKNLDDLLQDEHGKISPDSIVVKAGGHIWKRFKSGTPVNTAGGNKKMWVRLSYVGAEAKPSPIKPKFADDDFAAMTITVTNNSSVPSDPPTSPPGATVLDGPDPVP